MITVKFFGLISVDHNIKQLIVKEGKVRDVLKEIILQCPNLSNQQLMQAIMIINKKRTSGNTRFSIELKDGDELVFLNPSSGG